MATADQVLRRASSLLIISALCIASHVHAAMAAAAVDAATSANVQMVNHMAWTRSTRDSYYGTKATMGVYELPNVGDLQMSSAVMQLTNDDHGEGMLEVIEAGWHVSPDMYDDTKAHLYVYWRTPDGSCFNSLCTGFVLTQGHTVYPGMTLATDVPKYITLTISRAQTGDWYLMYKDEAVTATVGYWPASMFKGLQNKATQVRVGGRISTPVDAHGYPPMGSGHLATDGEGAAAYFRDIQLIDENGQACVYYDFDVVADLPRCYDAVAMPPNSFGDLARIYYGGPWGCKV